MLSLDEIEKRLLATGEVDFVQAVGDGYHYKVTIVSDVFIGQSKVARQQWVYACLNDWIVSGQLHALSMVTWTTKEWEKQRG